MTKNTYRRREPSAGRAAHLRRALQRSSATPVQQPAATRPERASHRAACRAAATLQATRQRDQRVPPGRMNHSMNPQVKPPPGILERYRHEKIRAVVSALDELIVDLDATIVVEDEDLQADACRCAAVGGNHLPGEFDDVAKTVCVVPRLEGEFP